MQSDQIGEIRVFAVAFGYRRHCSVQYGTLTAAESFVIGEEEELVLAVIQLRDQDRPTCGEPELILAKLTLLNSAGVFEEVRSIQFIVAQEFPDGAVESVGAGLDGGVENGGTGAAELGAEIGSLHFEFFHRVHGRKNHVVGAIEEVHGVGIVVDAIE